MKKTADIFDLRNKQIKQIEFANNSHLYVTKWEFWRYRDGINIGAELSKDGNFKRPWLILYSLPKTSLVVIVPCTTKCYDKNYNYLIPLHDPIKYGMKQSWFMLHQIKIIDKKRLTQKIKKAYPHLADSITKEHINLIKKLSSEEKSIQTRGP